MRDPFLQLTLWAICCFPAALLWFALGAVCTNVLALGDPPWLVDLAITLLLSLLLYAAARRAGVVGPYR